MQTATLRCRAYCRGVTFAYFHLILPSFEHQHFAIGSADQAQFHSPLLFMNSAAMRMGGHGTS